MSFESQARLAISKEEDALVYSLGATCCWLGESAQPAPGRLSPGGLWEQAAGQISCGSPLLVSHSPEQRSPSLSYELSDLQEERVVDLGEGNLVGSDR